MKFLFLRAALALVLGALSCSSALAQRQMETLNRGLIAMRKNSSEVYLGWRRFGNDPANVLFNLYRSANGGSATKLNASPITATTDYTDNAGSTNLTNNAYSYFVRPVINGVEQGNSEIAALPAGADQKQFLTLPLRTDTGPAGPYEVKFCWVGDLDGDGDFDYIVDRLSTQGENGQFLEAYKNDGTFLWRMAMGPNSVFQYAYEPGSSAISIGDTDNVTVFDMDGDGKAEVLVRTANGVTVRNAVGTQVASVTAASNSTQFLSVIDGLTGAERARAPLPNAWAVHGTLTNKAMIAYLDGKCPSVVMYGYNRADSGAFYRQFTAWNFRDGALTQLWTLAQDPSVMPGAEGHQIRIADVDNDGKDEICDLGHVIDDNGTQLFYNELTHGDRFHIADINPDRPGLETFAIQQFNPTSLATALYDSGTGAMIKKWYSNSPVDVGRGIALDISSAHKGYEMYSTQPAIFNSKGEQIYTNNVWAPEGLWWDGDFGREFIDGAGSGAYNPTIDHFIESTGSKARLFTIYNDWGSFSTRQAYGGRPAFWGDILGDWREEIVLMQSDYAALRIYTTTTPAQPNRIYTLMHNPQYRCQATTKGYVQASYVDYYLGFGMPLEVPPPPMVSATLTWSGGSAWDVGGSASWKNSAGVSSTYAQGESVLFDLSGSNTSAIALDANLTPSAVSFFNPQNFALTGTGSLSGAMTFSKSGPGTTTVAGTHGFTGATTIWDGTLEINGQWSSSPVTVWGGTWGGALAKGQKGGRLAGSGIISEPVTVGYRGAITPGAGMGSAATLQLGSSLTAADGAVLALDLSDDPTGVSKPNDRIAVAGNLNLSGTVAIVIHAMDGALAPGTYTLLTYGGSLAGSLANLAIILPEGTAHTLSVGTGTIRLVVPVTRAPASITWTGGQGGNTWDLFTTENWSRSGTPDKFVSGDTVNFDATGSLNPNVNLTAALPIAGVTVNSSSNYQFSGTGAVAGAGGLTKSGSGTLTLATTNTYTGATTISGGILAVNNLGDAGDPSSIGAAVAAASNLVINGGTLALVGPQTSTNRSMSLGFAGGTLSVPKATSLQISGQLTGSGALTKSGPGTLVFSSASNYSGGTNILEGALQLSSDTANVSGLGSGLVTLDGGTLSMVDNNNISSAANSNWNLRVPAGSWGRLNADGRCTLSGALTGGGDFTFYTPFVRTALSGNWSAFTGAIEVISDADGGDLRIENAAGYPSARLDLGAKVYAYYNLGMSSNLSIPIGTLSGSSSAVLLGGPTSGRTLTWQVGGRNENSTYAGVIANSSGPTALTKSGAGTLTLTGANTYSGATTVSNGRLQINGSSQNTIYTVQNGGTLGGSGSIAGNVSVQTGGALEHNTYDGGTLAITGNLTLPSSVLVRAPAGVALQAGTYTILTYSGSLTGTPSFNWEAPAGSYLVATFDQSTAGTIMMTLSQPPRVPGPITWTGANNFNWDTATQNWTAGGVAAFYQPGDSPTFTDSGIATSAINLVANVQPTEVVVSAAKNYTFSGSGVITGTSALSKSGSGTLTLTRMHTFSGMTSISGGILAITQTGSGGGAIGATLGSGGIALSNGGNFQLGSTNGKNFPQNPITVEADSSGSLSSVSLTNAYGGYITGEAGSLIILSGPVSMGASGSDQFGGFDGSVVIPSGSQLRFSSSSGPNGNGGSGTTFQIDGTMSTRNAGGTNGVILGALSGTGSIQGQSSTPVGTVTYLIGEKNLDTTFSGVIGNGSNGSSGINKLGSGTLTLSGVNTYGGTTTVTAGKLSITGSLAATVTTVETGGTLGGSGSIGGVVTCNGTLAPGVTAGMLTLSAGLTLASTSTLEYELGTISDLTAVTGNLTLAGTLNITAAPGFAAGTYTLITYSGTLTNNVLDVGSLPAGYTASINTASAGQVRLVVSAANKPPEITAGPIPSADPVDTTSTDVSVTANDDGGEENLIYTWSSTGPATVSFSVNDSNAAKNTTATFSAAGSYTLTANVLDSSGLSASNSVSLSVAATPSTLAVTPAEATLAVGDTAEFSVELLDQFSSPIVGASVIWSASGGGTINESGHFIAATTGGPHQIIATTDGLSANATVTVAPELTGFSAWEVGSFTPEQIAAGESDPSADPDNDGLTNLAEYALGSLPYAFTPPVAGVYQEGSFSITFQRPRSLPDVTYHAEFSHNLASWKALSLEILSNDADPETVRATYLYPDPKPAKSYLRLRFVK